LSVVYQHVQDVPVPPSEISAGSPPELDGLVMRSLAKEPDDRFQSAEEMRGLVQYGLQMLQQQGGFTGTWSTGAVEHGTDATTALRGGPGGPTVVMGQGSGYGAGGYGVGATAQRPMLPPTNPNDGGFNGYDEGAGPGGPRRGGRGKMVLFVALALVAIVGGVAFALNGMNNDGKTPDNGTPSPSVSRSQTSDTPSPGDTPSQDDQQSQDSTDGGSQDGTDLPPSENFPNPTRTHEQQPTNEPSDPQNSGSAGGGDTQGGGPSNPPQSSPPPGGDDGGTGTSDGGTGTSDGGSTDDGGTGTSDGGTGTSDGGTGPSDGGTSSGTDAGSTNAGTLSIGGSSGH
jgi:hypothetical protein